MLFSRELYLGYFDTFGRERCMQADCEAQIVARNKPPQGA